MFVRMFLRTLMAAPLLPPAITELHRSLPAGTYPGSPGLTGSQRFIDARSSLGSVRAASNALAVDPAKLADEAGFAAETGDSGTSRIPGAAGKSGTEMAGASWCA